MSAEYQVGILVISAVTLLWGFFWGFICGRVYEQQKSGN